MSKLVLSMFALLSILALCAIAVDAAVDRTKAALIGAPQCTSDADCAALCEAMPEVYGPDCDGGPQP